MKKVIFLSSCQIFEINIFYGAARIRRFRYSDLVKFTDFKSSLGEGGFGKVYRGELKDGTIVAVKVRSQKFTQETEQFQNEVYIKFIFRIEYN